MERRVVRWDGIGWDGWYEARVSRTGSAKHSIQGYRRRGLRLLDLGWCEVHKVKTMTITIAI